MLIWRKNQRKVRYRTFQLRYSQSVAVVCDVCSSDREAEPGGGVRVLEGETDLLHDPALISLRSEGFFHCSWCEKDYCRTHAAGLRTPVNNIEYFPPNFEGLVLGCIDASKQASKYVQSLPEKKRDPGIRAQLK